MSGRFERWRRTPYSLRVLLYYLVVFFLFRYLVHGHLEDRLARQLLGVGETLVLTLFVLFHLLLCAIPPWLWSRYSTGRTLSRGVESFACYVAVFLLLGAVYSLAERGSWQAWNGLTMGRGPWERALTTGGLFFLFLGSAWWGGRKSGRRRARRRRGKD